MAAGTPDARFRHGRDAGCWLYSVEEITAARLRQTYVKFM